MQQVQIFFSYSHKDEKLMNKVRQQLIPYEREGILVKWHEREIRAGQQWNPIIKQKLLSSHIILLLVSPDFMESRYCYNLEMKEALTRHERGEAVVIPVILRPCMWQDTPIGKLQALPKDGKPVTNWSKIDDATFNIAVGLLRWCVDWLQKTKFIRNDSICIRLFSSKSQYATGVEVPNARVV